MKEVHALFLNQQDFKVDPQLATVTIFVLTIVRNKAVSEEVVLTLEKEEMTISNEVLVEEIMKLQEKVADLERKWKYSQQLAITDRQE